MFLVTSGKLSYSATFFVHGKNILCLSYYNFNSL